MGQENKARAWRPMQVWGAYKIPLVAEYITSLSELMEMSHRDKLIRDAMSLPIRTPNGSVA